MSQPPVLHETVGGDHHPRRRLFNLNSYTDSKVNTKAWMIFTNIMLCAGSEKRRWIGRTATVSKILRSFKPGIRELCEDNCEREKR